ncbi:MAG: DUF4020 domain-containing protein [Chloroflexi bacterium]|nr:DUF4020 domain-containing protein [Chloroflexota bacterium]
MTPDQKIEWLISSGGLDDVGTRHESRQLISRTYPDATTQTRQRLIQAIKDVFASGEMESGEPSDNDRKIYDWFDVLLGADPDCELAQTAFQELQTRYPEWEPWDEPALPFHVEGPYWVRDVSPWAVEDLLSRPAAELVNEVLDFKPSPWGTPIDRDRMEEENAAKAVREVATRDVSKGLNVANELVRREVWQQVLWRELLEAWKESELNEQQYSQVLTLLHSPKLFDKNGKGITDLLLTLVRNGGKQYAMRLMPTAKSLALSIWNESKNSKSWILSETDWFTLALNSNAGLVVRFWLSAMWVESERGKKRIGRFNEDDRQFFDSVVEDSDMRGKLGQAMLATHIGYLLSFDYDWTTKRLLPLFDPEHASFVPAWHGFTWGQLRSDVGELMKPKFLSAVENIHRFEHVGVPSRRSEFVRRYANMMVYNIDEPLIKWAPELFKNGDDVDRYTFAWEIGRILENMADAQKIELWHRWLRRYWQNRLSGVPRPLEKMEVEEMLRWPKDLQVVFDEAVKLTVRMPSANLELMRISKDYVDEELARRFPSGSAQLLEYLDRIEPNTGDWDGIENVIDVLTTSHLDTALKEKVKDIGVRRVVGVAV